ncbi:MAG: hypothetical protein ACTSRI_20500, partial [Promethearchaeota archaeon]
QLFFITLHHPTDIDTFKEILEVCKELLEVKAQKFLRTREIKSRVSSNQPSVDEHLNLFSYMNLFIKKYFNPDEDDYSFIFSPTDYFYYFFTQNGNIKRNWKDILIERLLCMEIINNAIYREDFFELKNLRLRPYLVSMLILERLNRILDDGYKKKITQNLVIAILCTLMNENLRPINNQIRKIYRFLKKEDNMTSDDIIELLYPSIAQEVDAIGVNAATHELSRIQSVIMKPLKQLGLIIKDKHLKLTDKGKKFLKKYINIKPLWWNDIGGVFNAAFLLLIKEIKNIDYNLFETIISQRIPDKDISSLLDDFKKLGIRKVGEELILKTDIQFNLLDIPYFLHNNFKSLYNELEQDLLLKSYPKNVRNYVKDLILKFYQLKKEYNELNEKYNNVTQRLLHNEDIDKWELSLRKKNPELINLGIPKSLWDIDLVAKNDPIAANYYQEVFKKAIWDVFELKTWDAFKYLGMKVIKLGHLKRFVSLPGSGIINFRTTRRHGMMAYLILIDNKCTKHTFDLERFNDYKDKLKDYIFDAILSSSSQYANCNPDYFIILSSDFSDDLMDEVKKCEDEELNKIDTKIKLMRGTGLSRLVYEHAKKPFAIKEREGMFERNILDYDGIIDDKVIFDNFYSKISE